jgi:glutathione S-transferase
MLRLYDSLPSGNAYKVRLLLSQLEIPFERVDVDVLAGAARRPEFLAVNPAGKVPALRLEDGSLLTESNAILWYLAHGTPLSPRSVRMQADVLRWMFFEQNALEPHLAMARYYLTLSGEPERHRDSALRHQKRAHEALRVLEQHLVTHRFMVAGAYTIADIALYAYTHVADEAGIGLNGYPAVQRWLDRVALEPQHVAIGELCGVTVRG